MDSDDEIPMDSGSEQEDLDDEFLTTTELEDEMKESISDLQDVLEVSPGICRILLHKYKWSKETLLEKFYEHSDTSAFLLAAQVIPKESKPEKGECDICCDVADLFGLACDHRACRECWKAYLKEKIEAGSSEIQCMATDCKVVVEDEKVFDYIDDSELAKTYRKLILNSYVEMNELLKWCPGVNCGRAVKINNRDPHPILCPCGARFCFNCGTDCHEPVTCHLLKLWTRRCQDDSETFNWIIANTKDCPKCFTPIEKNGGCNRIQCKNASCLFEFCWQCMRIWSVHGYQPCNTFESKEANKTREKSRISVERYLFYYNRYYNHMKSLSLEMKLKGAIAQRMEQMQELGQGWVEVQYLQKAVDVLRECRQLMTYTYVFAFYLEKDNNAELFETNQNDLEMAVEQLSGFLEQDLENEDLVTLKQKVLDKCRYVEQRQKILMDQCREGFEQDIWVFKEDNLPAKK